MYSKLLIIRYPHLFRWWCLSICTMWLMFHLCDFRGLLGGHSLAIMLKEKGEYMQWYNDELLQMAKQLGYKLLPAFNTTSGLPYPRVSNSEKYGSLCILLHYCKKKSIFVIQPLFLTCLRLGKKFFKLYKKFILTFQLVCIWMVWEFRLVKAFYVSLRNTIDYAAEGRNRCQTGIWAQNYLCRRYGGSVRVGVNSPEERV